MPYGIIFEAIEVLQEAKLQQDELDRKNQELSDIVSTGISNQKIPECSMSYSIVSREAIKMKNKLEETNTQLSQLQQ